MHYSRRGKEVGVKSPCTGALTCGPHGELHIVRLDSWLVTELVRRGCTLSRFYLDSTSGLHKEK
jgi:hypothetical protein